MADVFDQVAQPSSSPPPITGAQPAATAAPAQGDLFDQVEQDPSLALRAPAPPMPTRRPASQQEFENAQFAGGYSEPAERSGRPVTYLMQRPDESYPDFLKRAVAHSKTVTPQQIEDEANQPMKAALGVPARVAEAGAGSFAGLASAAEAIDAGGPAARKALEWMVNWAKNNKAATGLGLMYAINTGLEAAGLPRASRLVEKLELPAILLLGGGKAGEAAAEGEAAEASSGGTQASAAAGRETPEQFVDRVAGNGRAPIAPPPKGNYRVYSEGGVREHPKTNEMFGEGADGETIDLRSAEQKQASLGEEAGKPQGEPQVWKRGPKKGQPKTYRVFDQGKWVELPVLK